MGLPRHRRRKQHAGRQTDEPCGLRRRCDELIRTLPIPHPFDMPTFLNRLAQHRRRHIELVPVALSAALPCGLLISTDDADYVCHAVDTSPLHAQHIVMHEVGHLVFGHTSKSEAANIPLDGRRVAEQAAVRTLLPDLSPAMIQRILGRTTYSDVHEREAEQFASMLLARICGSSDRKSQGSEVGRPWAA